jgi:trehalose 6-phosphate synthase/phosphatase
MAPGDGTTAAPRLLIVSNRLPVTIRQDDNDYTIERSSGGLATALSHPHAALDSLWLGWPGSAYESADDRRRLTRLLRSTYRFSPVYLTDEQVQRYYYGFSNGALWPLCHFFEAHVVYDDDQWEAYVEVNRLFCDAVADEIHGDELIWVHDYHLFLLPEMLRQRFPETRIGFFLHTPFPPSELFRVLPCREALLRGLLGADVVGFQTFNNLQNFLYSVYRVLGIAADMNALSHEGRPVNCAVHPISVDPAQFLEALDSDADTLQESRRLNEAMGKRKVILGMDRLDYSKGIPGRLRAYQRLLGTHPEWREAVTLVQVAVPSREQVTAYQDLRRQVDELVGEINGTYGTTTWTPVQYVHRNLPFAEICALLRRADIALVTPLRDGMNLVAKEYAVCQKAGAGALILSEFAGASSELGEAFFVNPYDTEGMATRMHEVLSSPEEALADRMGALHRRVCGHTVHAWAQKFLDELAAVQTQRTPCPLNDAAQRRLLVAYAKAKKRVLLLGYDGAAASSVERWYRSAPGADLLDALQTLSRDPCNTVAVLSSRDRDTMEHWFGSCVGLLVAEDGGWIRESARAPWRQTLADLDDAWKDTVRPILEEAITRTPGSTLVERGHSLGWQYHLADPEFGLWQAHELYGQLQALLAGSGLQVQRGNKMVEIKWAEIHKGMVGAQIISAAQGAFMIAIGGQPSDEALFEAVPAEQWTLKTGTGFSRARFVLPTTADAIALLQTLAELSA